MTMVRQSGFLVHTAFLSALLCLVVLTACVRKPIPEKYIRQAQPGVTLSSLVKNPQAYQGKVVILGGVVVAQRLDGEKIWLLVKNRPLDEDYRPHELLSPRDAEAGQYWIVIRPQDFSYSYRTWARLTVVGRVTDDRPSDAEPGPEPTLAALHLRGWSLSGRGDVWEDNQDANYIMSTPRPVTRN
jgi:starvation-inducible outer membrane lipoprotein